jgi:hypothetical protein
MVPVEPTVPGETPEDPTPMFPAPKLPVPAALESIGEPVIVLAVLPIVVPGAPLMVDPDVPKPVPETVPGC